MVRSQGVMERTGQSATAKASSSGALRGRRAAMVLPVGPDGEPSVALPPLQAHLLSPAKGVVWSCSVGAESVATSVRF